VIAWTEGEGSDNALTLSRQRFPETALRRTRLAIPAAPSIGTCRRSARALGGGDAPIIPAIVLVVVLVIVLATVVAIVVAIVVGIVLVVVLAVVLVIVIVVVIVLAIRFVTPGREP
jgi:hypothetical protein